MRLSAFLIGHCGSDRNADRDRDKTKDKEKNEKSERTHVSSHRS